MQLLQVIDLVPAHGLGLKHAGLVGPAFPFGDRSCAPHQIDTGRVVRDERVQRIHDEIQHLVQVERPADRLGDVEKHAQLVDG